MAEPTFSHLDRAGRLNMVDITGKDVTLRRAVARCLVRTVADPAVLATNTNGVDPLQVARVAGIQAAKHTSFLIPLCHPIPIDDIHVEISPASGVVEVVAEVTASYRTGVEMEALTACAFAALSIAGALKRADPLVQIDDLVLLRKSGGRSGEWGRLTTEGTNAP